MGAQVDRFPGTGNRVLPALGLLTVAVFVVLSLVDGWDRTDLLVWAAGALVVSVVAVVYLRPAVWATGQVLVLRQMVSTVEIPLAAVEKAAVGRFLVVFAGDHRHVSATVSRSLRSLMGAKRGGSAKPVTPATMNEADLVEEKLSRLAEDARARSGIGLYSDEQLALADDVRRTWSWPTIGALAGTALLVVLALVLV